MLNISHPTRANLSRSELGERLAQLYKTEAQRVVVFGLRAKFGGGSSQGFGLIYDDEESQKKFEPKYRLIRVSISTGRTSLVSRTGTSFPPVFITARTGRPTFSLFLC